MKYVFGPILDRCVVVSLVSLAILPGCTTPRTDYSEHDVSPQSSIVKFTDVTADAGLAGFRHVTGAFGEKWFPETMGSGIAFIDYNNNGWQDILIAGGGGWPRYDPDQQDIRAIWLFLNNGDGTFSDVTEASGLADVEAYGFGITVADYNNSGYQDFYLTTLGRNMLFENRGGSFVETAVEAGIAGDDVWSTAAIFFDSNRNGLLDLFVGNYVAWSPDLDLWCSRDGTAKSYCTPVLYEGIPANFYLNNGDGTFTDRTIEAGFSPAPGKTLGVVEVDLGNNGFPDLIVANDTDRDLLYINNGDGTFAEEGMVRGIAHGPDGRSRAGMGIDAGIVDETGYPTVFIGHFSHEMIGVYRYNGAGFFEERGAASGIGRPSLPTLTFGLFLIDVNLNGLPDLFVANGHIDEDVERTLENTTFRQSPQLFHNLGDGVFRDVSSEIKGAFDHAMVARGAAYADLNRNGRVDVAITENGGPVHLWRNDTAPAGNFLRVRLQGVRNNRSGISSRILAQAGGATLEYRITTGSSYLSGSELVATFGLGDSRQVDMLTIYWPNGHVDTFREIQVNKQILVTEGSQTYETEYEAVREIS